MLNKVLIIDDEPHIRTVIEMKLKNAGYEVRAEANAQAALDTAKEFCPDLILTDYRMPGSMTGVDLIYEVRKTEGIEHTPFILLTGSVAVINELNSVIKDAGRVTLMPKPFSPRNLVKEVKQILEEEGRADD